MEVAMGSDLVVGDSDRPYLDVVPADIDTAVTLQVRKPDGTTAAVTVTGGALVPIPNTSPQQNSQRWTATTPVVYDQAGHWVLHYTITGTGAGAEDRDVYVVASAAGSGPAWAPGRSRVAAYVPHRTLVRSTTSTTASADTYELTFSDETRPTGAQVDRLIADGVDWVTAQVTPLNVRSQPVAALVAALWAAVAVERSWPNDDQSLQRANDMEKRLDSMLAALIASNLVANGEDDDDDGDYGLDIAYPCDWNTANCP
jgi:hypothetical protein